MISSKKIYIKAYTRLNLGDDLFVFILCARYPKHQFYIKEQGIYTDTFKKIKNLTIIQNVDDENYDAIVYIGGSIFIQNSSTSIGRLLDLKIEIIKENIPTYIIGANFGPYTTDEYFTTTKNELFPHIHSITFRDKYSYNLFSDMSNVNYSPDVVFSIDTNNIKKDVSNEIGISIIHHLERELLKKHYPEYLEKLIEISKHYIHMGYNVRLFSFCEYEKDMLAINDFINKLTPQERQHIVISNYTGDVLEILNQIAGLKLFITSRFHSMILGLKLGVPIIPICYSDKSSNVLNDMGFPKDEIYTFENLDCIKYIKIPDVFYNEKYFNSDAQFKDLDILLAP